MQIKFLVHNFYFPGGTNKAIANLANALAEKGVDISIVSVISRKTDFSFSLHRTIKTETIIKYDFKNPLPIMINRLSHYTPLFKPQLMDQQETGYAQYNAYIEQQIKKYIQQHKDCIFVGTRPILNMMIAKHHRGLKIGMEHAVAAAHAASVQLKMKKLYPKLNCVTTLTAIDSKFYQQLNPDIQTAVIPNIVSVNTTAKQKERIIIAAGRLEYEKGFDLLITAAAKCKIELRQQQYQIHIYGDGSLKQQLLSMIKTLEVEDLITIYPPTNQLEEHIAAASLTCIPSRFEGFGLVIFEAMLLKSIVVAFHCYNGPRTYLNEHNAYIAQPEDSSSLAEAMKEAMISNNEHMCSLALETAEQFNPNHVVNQFLALLT